MTSNFHSTTTDFKILDYLESIQSRLSASSTRNLSQSHQNLKHTVQEDIINKKYLSMNLETITARLFSKVKPKKELKCSQSTEKNLSLAKELLRHKNNICFYGLGSKTECVNLFLRKHFEKSHLIITIRGLDNNLNLKNLLVRIIHKIQQEYKINSQEISFKELMNVKSINVNFLVQSFTEVVKRCGENLLIVFHNLDAPNFLNKKTLEILSRISFIKAVTFAATVDSVVFQNYFSQDIIENFSFSFFEINTFVLYEWELRYLKCFEFSKRGNKNLESVNGILESMTETQRFTHKKFGFVHFFLLFGDKQATLRGVDTFPGSAEQNENQFDEPVSRKSKRSLHA